jgi:hypothetical protein
MAPVPEFGAIHLRRAYDVLGNADVGLTGAEFGQLFQHAGIRTPSPQ